MFQLLLFHLFISTVTLSPSVNSGCSDKKDKLFDQLTSTLNEDYSINATLAKNLSIECWDVVKCSKNNPPSNKTIFFTSGSIDFSDQFCKLLDLLSGPIGTCLDKVRDVHNTFQVFGCEQEVKGIDNSTCSTIFNTCSQEAINDYCDAEVTKSLQDHRKLLESFNCTGAMLYNPAEIIKKDTQNPKIDWTVSVGEPDLLSLGLVWFFRLLFVAFVVGMVYVCIKWRKGS